MSTVINAGDEVAYDERFLGWLRDHAIEPNDTYKVEIQGGVATVYTYARDGGGCLYYDPCVDGPAVREPFTIRCDSQPPVGEGHE